MSKRKQPTQADARSSDPPAPTDPPAPAPGVRFTLFQKNLAFLFGASRRIARKGPMSV